MSSIDAATIRYVRRLRLGEYEHHEAEASLSVRPGEDGSVSEQALASAASQALSIVLGTLSAKIEQVKQAPRQSDVQPTMTATQATQAAQAAAEAPKRGRPLKKVEAPAVAPVDPLADLVGGSSAPATVEKSAAPVVKAAIPDEELQKIAVASLPHITAEGVKAIIREMGFKGLTLIPDDRRAEFKGLVDKAVAAAKAKAKV